MYSKKSYTIHEIISRLLSIASSPDYPATLDELKEKLPFICGEEDVWIRIGTAMHIFPKTDPTVAEALAYLISQEVIWLGRTEIIPLMDTSLWQ